ncbi:MAG: TonB-dependent receptor [Nannocystaceae bacterium]
MYCFAFALLVGALQTTEPAPSHPVAPSGRRETVGSESDAPSGTAVEPAPSGSELPVRLPTASIHEPAATGRLRGHVFAHGSRDRLAAVKVLRADGEGGTETDVEGAFQLALEPGTYALLIRADGYLDLKTSVTVVAGEEVVLVWRLRADLDAARFRTLVESEREVAVSRTVLRDEEIHDVPGTRGDPFRVVKSLPGVSQVAGFLPYVVVRGAAPGNTGYYLDGVRVPILFHVAIGPSVIHPYFIDEVHFYPGGTPVRLGRFSSGIIEGRTKQARRDRVSGEVDLRITDAGALLEVPINRAVAPGCAEPDRHKCKKGRARGALTFGGRFSYTGWLLSSFKGLNVKLSFWDYQARFDHDVGRRLRYTAFAYGSYDSMGPREEYSFADEGTDTDNQGIPGEDSEEEWDDPGEPKVNKDPDPYLRFEFHRFDHRLRQQLQNGGRVLYKLAFGFDRSGVEVIKTKEWLVTPRLELRWPLSKTAALGIGLDQEFKIFRVDAELSDIDPTAVEDVALFLSSRFVSATGLWTDLRWSQGKVELRPGVRVDAYAQVGASPYLPQARNITHALGIDPRLLAREELSSRWTLRQAAGVYHQPPDFAVPLPGVESLGFDRGLQRNIQGSVGYEFSLGSQATLTQDVYLGRLTNLQDFEIAENSDDPINELEDVLTSVSGWTYGFETMLKLSPRNRLFGWVAYTLSRATRAFPVGGEVPSTWDQTHLLNIVLGYKIAHKYRVGGRLHVNTGRPYTAARAGQTYMQALAKNRNNARLPTFFQFDLRAERIFVFARWELHLVLDVTNSTMTREFLACGPSHGEDEDPALGLRGCPSPIALRYVIPSVGMRGVF